MMSTIIVLTIPFIFTLFFYIHNSQILYISVINKKNNIEECIMKLKIILI